MVINYEDAITVNKHKERWLVAVAGAKKSLGAVLTHLVGMFKLHAH